MKIESIEQLKEVLKALEDKSICELFTDNNQCEKCFFYYEETGECVKTVFVQGALGELE